MAACSLAESDGGLETGHSQNDFPGNRASMHCIRPPSRRGRKRDERANLRRRSGLSRLARTSSLPAWLWARSNPSLPGRAGGQGVSRLAGAGGILLLNHRTQRATCFVGPALRTPSHHTAGFASPRGLVRGRGSADTVSALGHVLLPRVSDRSGLRRARRRWPPCIPHQGALDPVGWRRWRAHRTRVGRARALQQSCSNRAPPLNPIAPPPPATRAPRPGLDFGKGFSILRVRSKDFDPRVANTGTRGIISYGRLPIAANS